MTAEEKILFKQKLKHYCIAEIEKRIANAAQAMRQAQAAANEEEKSSAGDKYETSRAMSHIEKDMHGKQLAANRLELATLMEVDCSRLYTSVNIGALVICEGSSFFIAAGLGKVIFEGEAIYILSPKAPVAAMLLGKKAADKVNFNKLDLLIKAIY